MSHTFQARAVQAANKPLSAILDLIVTLSLNL